MFSNVRLWPVAQMCYRVPQGLAIGQEVSGTGWQTRKPRQKNVIFVLKTSPAPSGPVGGASAGHIQLGSCTGAFHEVSA